MRMAAFCLVELVRRGLGGGVNLFYAAAVGLGVFNRASSWCYCVAPVPVCVYECV